MIDIVTGALRGGAGCAAHHYANTIHFTLGTSPHDR